MAKIKFKSDGGSGEVTGSKHYITFGKEQYLLDCGGWQGSQDVEKKNQEYSFEAEKINGVFNSHCHFDHCGLLPKLVEEGFKGRIYATPATRDLSSIIMLDSAKIQSYSGNRVYTEEDCLETMKHFKCVQYGKKKKISDGLEATFYDAGHVLGSAMIELSFDKHSPFLKRVFSRGDDTTRVLFTGDIGRNGNPICNSPEINMLPPDYIIMESTYGDRTHESFDTVYQELTYIVNRTIERGGKVIIPSFAVERAQEIIYFLKVLMRDGKIPRVPVIVDSPMAANATGVFNIHTECFNDDIKRKFISKGKNPFSVRSLHFVNNYKESIRIAKSKRPAIIISCNGMCESGRIINHLKHGINNQNNTLLFIGYQSDGTLGKQILNKAEVVSIDNKKYNVKAEIHKIGGMSAHADYREMLCWLSKIDTSRLKKIFLVHGEPDSQKFFAERLQSAGYNVEIAERSAEYILK